jgi:Tfp pilus assembly protein PilV
MLKLCKSSSQSGFLLGEALIGLSILAIGLLAVSEAMRASHQAIARGRERNAIAACAQAELVKRVGGSVIGEGICESLKTSETSVAAGPRFNRTQLRMAPLNGQSRKEALFETITASR